MRIGIDIRPALKAKTGVGNYVFNLVTALAGLDRENQYALFSNSLKDRCGFPLIRALPNWRLKDYRFPNKLMNYVWNNIGGLPINMLIGDVDVFHFTGAIAPSIKGLATIATAYDLFHVRHPESVEPRHRVSLQDLKACLNSVSAIIAISEFTKSDLVGFLGISPEKITVVPLGVDTGIFKPMQGSEEYLKNRFALEGDYILHVGTLENRKNILPLLDAFGLIRNQHPQLKLVLAGSPGKGFEQILEKMQRSGLEKSIRCLGYLESDQDLPYLYSGASAFVFPSLYEGFGLPVLEAFACGTPVAASNCTSIPEVAGDAALLFDPQKPDDMAEKILRILEAPDLVQALKEKSKTRVGAYTWAETAKKTLRIYKNTGENK